MGICLSRDENNNANRHVRSAILPNSKAPTFRLRHESKDTSRLINEIRIQEVIDKIIEDVENKSQIRLEKQVENQVENQVEKQVEKQVALNIQVSSMGKCFASKYIY